MSGKQLHPETGCRPRTVDIETILQTATIPDLGKPKGSNMFVRIAEGLPYLNRLNETQLFLYNRSMITEPGTKVLAQDDHNNLYYGINFASTDYLGLSRHQTARENAIKAVQKYGMSTGGTPTTIGMHRLQEQLQKQISQFWGIHMVIYPTGWMAGFGAIKGLIRDGDFIIMDQISHNCLQEGAFAATKNVRRFEHLNQEAMEKMVRQTRQENPDAAILVITEGLFSMDADSPDVNFYQQVTKKHGAFLLLDCAHDFGHLGHGGKGIVEVQGVKDLSNMILLGTGSKCLGTHLGFVGAKDPKVIEFLKLSPCLTDSVTISPPQAASALSQVRALGSVQGVKNRKKIAESYNYVRKRLEEKGHKIMGNTCAFVVILVGNELVNRLVSRIMMDMGIHVNGIEYPVVRIGMARQRMGLIPEHTKEDLDSFIEIFEKALAESNAIFEKSMKDYSDKMNKQEQSKL